MKGTMALREEQKREVYRTGQEITNLESVTLGLEGQLPRTGFPNHAAC